MPECRTELLLGAHAAVREAGSTAKKDDLGSDSQKERLTLTRRHAEGTEDSESPPNLVLLWRQLQRIQRSLGWGGLEKNNTQDVCAGLGDDCKNSTFGF